MPPLTIEPRPDGYWIVGLEEDGQPLDCGPYDRRTDADSDRVGMTRFLRHHDKPGWMTTDTPAVSVRRPRKRKTPAPREERRPRQLLAF
ncbi:MAG: hypothetical protein HQ567_16010 [Candidatus Nealsonbacteria bacterium]|nr:hypothetical protein [Candidatus Nealsonbacteria bacterium]